MLQRLGLVGGLVNQPAIVGGGVAPEAPGLGPHRLDDVAAFVRAAFVIEVLAPGTSLSASCQDPHALARQPQQFLGLLDQRRRVLVGQALDVVIEAA